MSWRELITGIYESRTLQSGIAGKPRFHPAASPTSVAETEAALKATLPTSLRSLLLETDGVMDMMAIDGGEWLESMWLMWTIDELVEQNRFYRAATKAETYERDFRKLVFFAGAGFDGILFAFPVEDGVCVPRVIVWYPIMDEVDELAPSLEAFLRGWLTGAISI